MNKFWKIIDWILDKLKLIGAVSLGGMMLLTCVDVVGRKLDHPILGAVEIVGFMATIVVAAALPYTDKIQGHVGVEILVRLFSEKTQIVINISTRLLSLGLFAILTWQMALYAKTMKESGEVSISLELPEHMIIYATAFCCLVFTLVIIKEIIDNIKKLKEI